MIWPKHDEWIDNPDKPQGEGLLRWEMYHVVNIKKKERELIRRKKAQSQTMNSQGTAQIQEPGQLVEIRGMWSPVYQYHHMWSWVPCSMENIHTMKDWLNKTIYIYIYIVNGHYCIGIAISPTIHPPIHLSTHPSNKSWIYIYMQAIKHPPINCINYLGSVIIYTFMPSEKAVNSKILTLTYGQCFIFHVELPALWLLKHSSTCDEHSSTGTHSSGIIPFNSLPCTDTRPCNYVSMAN